MKMQPQRYLAGKNHAFCQPPNNAPRSIPLEWPKASTPPRWQKPRFLPAAKQRASLNSAGMARGLNATSLAKTTLFASRQTTRLAQFCWNGQRPFQPIKKDRP
jgi:hypothetical protein